MEPWPDFHVGVNYPWGNYGTDFGTSAWGNQGVGENSTAISSDFANLSEAGVKVVRWFILCDGRSSPEFNEQGEVTGLEDSFFSDMDSLLELSSEHEIFLVPVLLDFYWFSGSEMVNAVSLGGRTDIIQDPDKRKSLIDLVILPILQRYGDHPNIYAWDIINEPEHAMDFQAAGWLGGGIAAEELLDFVDQVTQAIHMNTKHLATVGSADLESMQEYWLESDLDLLQFHHYKDDIFDENYSQILDERDVVVGEFSSVEHSVQDSLSRIQQGGFSGAWVWSMNAEDQHSSLELNDLRNWNKEQ
jgi:hypothetical protein